MVDSFFASDLLSDAAKAALGGLCVGILFGFAAQRSDFCLRAATIEFWSGRVGERFVVWLLVFGMALVSVQALLMTGFVPKEEVRQLSNPGTLSGAIIGGALFGVGMILARGCASRLLVLSATGNMRAFVTGLVLTIVAQASLTGMLAPVREGLASLSVIPPETRDLGSHLPTGTGLVAGAMILIAATVIGLRARLPASRFLFGSAVGLAVAAGWAYTAALSEMAFDPVPVESITFTGPSANTLMALINAPDLPLNFGIGLVPGVFAGSALSALLSSRFRLQAFSADTGMARYLIGAALMGFGGMLAGGCAVGAGITGGSVLSLTAWLALFAMWVSAGLTNAALSRRPAYAGQMGQ